MTSQIHLTQTYYCPFEGQEIPASACPSQEDDPCDFFNKERKRCEAGNLKHTIRTARQLALHKSRRKFHSHRVRGARSRRPTSRYLLGSPKTSGSSTDDRMYNSPQAKYDETPLVWPEMPRVNSVFNIETERGNEIRKCESDSTLTNEQIQKNIALTQEPTPEIPPENIQFEITDDHLSLVAEQNSLPVDCDNPTYTVEHKTNFHSSIPNPANEPDGVDVNMLNPGDIQPGDHYDPVDSAISLDLSQISTPRPSVGAEPPMGLSTSLPDQGIIDTDLLPESNVDLSEPYPKPFTV